MAVFPHNPGKEKVAQPPLAVLFKSRRGRLLCLAKEFFPVKACGHIFSSDLMIILKNLLRLSCSPHFTGSTGILPLGHGLEARAADTFFLVPKLLLGNPSDAMLRFALARPGVLVCPETWGGKAKRIPPFVCFRSHSAGSASSSSLAANSPGAPVGG